MMVSVRRDMWTVRCEIRAQKANVTPARSEVSHFPASGATGPESIKTTLLGRLICLVIRLVGRRSQVIRPRTAWKGTRRGLAVSLGQSRFPDALLGPQALPK